MVNTIDLLRISKQGLHAAGATFFDRRAQTLYQFSTLESIWMYELHENSLHTKDVIGSVTRWVCD